jgi:uncharacterized membrane protein YfcA
VSVDLLLPLLAAGFVAAFLKGITGLGFSTICLGLLASVIDLKLAIPAVLVPSLSSNVLVMVQARGFPATLTRFWPLYLAALPGLAVGLALLASVDSATARRVLGAVLFLYGLWALANHRVALPARAERWLNVPVGVATGVVNGLTGSQVMPVLPYLLSLRLAPDQFVQAINISFTASSVVMMAGLAHIGLMNLSVLGASTLAVVPVAVGIVLGGRVRRRLHERTFRHVVLLLLVALGVNLGLRA